MTGKEKLILKFNENVKGKKPDLSGKNIRHDGREGHWLERQFGITANCDNLADIYGYELKDQTTSGKTTFGDWSANRYIFSSGEYSYLFIGNTNFEKRNHFLKIFGKPNEAKNGRYSWSGSPCPKINNYNFFGQKLIINKTQDIEAIYNFDKDQRSDKYTIIPIELQKKEIVIAKWFGLSSPSSSRTDKCIKEKLEDKFNDNGWFTCKKDNTGAYYKICFGKPINFDSWIDLIKKGIVYFDSGMYEGNKRPYSQWRANNAFWDSLIIEEYK